MLIDKSPLLSDTCASREYFYENARQGLYDLLSTMIEHLHINTILVPGYVGWSPREGSGILDPISALSALSIRYYKVTKQLDVDLFDLSLQIEQCARREFVVLVVNYFGFMPDNAGDVARLVRDRNGWIIEDNAHGLFTFHSSAVSYGDASIFSLHKMLPFKAGGSLLIMSPYLKGLTFKGYTLSSTIYNPWQYSFKEISSRRVANYRCLARVIEQNSDGVLFSPLKAVLPVGVVPQSFPITIVRGSRDMAYHRLNDMGYGVVSLYHTLIEPLRNDRFAASLELAKTILNLPVHQDVDSIHYVSMVEELSHICRATVQVSGQ